jgi:hypothetical protein
VVCGKDSVAGANHPSCGHELAIKSLAVSPYACQARVAPTPVQNTIRERESLREALVTTDGCLFPVDERAIASSPGRAAPRSVGNSGGFGGTVEFGATVVESITTPPLSYGLF